MRRSLDELSSRFALPEELVRQDRAPEVAALLADIAGLDEWRIPAFAACLSGREVETLLFALTDDYRSADDESILLRLLDLRMSKRVIALIWAFYAERFEDPIMNSILKLAISFLDRTSLSVPQARTLNTVAGDDPIGTLGLAALAEGTSLNSFFWKYDISSRSPLAFAVAKKTLSICGGRIFAINEGWLIDLIRSGLAGAGELENYISSVNETDYSLSVNQAIIETMGKPISEGDWPGISERCREKFIRWCFLKELRDYFLPNKSKLSFFTIYLSYMKDVRTLARSPGHIDEAEDEHEADSGAGAEADAEIRAEAVAEADANTDANAKAAVEIAASADAGADIDTADAAATDDKILIIDFGEFAVLDNARDQDHAFLCDRDTLRKIERQNELRPADRILPEAREFILESVRGELTRLNFHKVGKLFARDMLGILLDIIPDTRAAKSILLTRQGRGARSRVA